MVINQSLVWSRDRGHVRLRCMRSCLSRFFSYFVLFLVAIVVSSCSFSFGGGVGAERFYHLYADTGLEVSSKESGSSILVRDMLADGFLQSRRIVFSGNPVQSFYYQTASWTDSPARQLTAMLISALSHRHHFAYTVGQESGARADYNMVTTLLDMRHDTTSSPGQVIVSIRAELVRSSDRAVIQSKVFNVSEPLASYDVDGAVSAFNKASNNVIDEIVMWCEILRPSQADTPTL